MWKIATRGFTLEEVLIMAAMNLLASAELDPIPQFKATAKLGKFLEARFSQSF
jgi:hypothetical protein